SCPRRTSPGSLMHRSAHGYQHGCRICFVPWQPCGMRAVVITGAGAARVEDVEEPVPGAGQVVVDVRRAGICGTDVELLTGQLAYFGQGKIGFPIRPGHEWCGVVSALGDGVDPGWLGARITGDTMLGCGRCSVR